MKTTKQEERELNTEITLLPMASIEIALDVQSKTLLNYEKAGILNPEIKEDNSRYYSLGDLERARIATILTKNKTMELQGVKVLLSVLNKTNIKPKDHSGYIQSILKLQNNN